MTRIQSFQVNDSKITYGRLSIDVTPGLSNVVLSPATISQITISDIPDGCVEKIQPQVFGNLVEPFSILPGEQLSIRIDNGPTSLVTFLNTDIYASNVCYRINQTVGSEIAFPYNGRVWIKSNGVSGSYGFIVITDTQGTPSAKLGLSVGTVYGKNEGSRGIVTLSNDGLGGVIPIKLPGKRSLVTENTSFTKSSSGPQYVYETDVIGGQPIHGRLINYGGNYVLGFYTKLPKKYSFISRTATYNLLDGTDSIQLTTHYGYSDVAFNVSFPSGPYTRDTVVDRFNEIYAQNVIGTTPQAFVRSEVSHPFTFHQESISIAVNGAAPVTVLLGNALNPVEYNASQVISALSVVPGLVAQLSNGNTEPDVNGSFIALTTASGIGKKSSIAINGNHSTLVKLGLMPGVYYGPYIAVADSANDIKFTAPNRGSVSKLTITGGNTQTLSRLGLTGISGGTASDDDFDVPVLTPRLVSQDGTITDYRIQTLIEEVVSFGEVKTDEAVDDFVSLSTGSNDDLRFDRAVFQSYGLTSKPPTLYRSAGGGQVVTTGPDGQIDLGLMNKSTNLFMKYAKQFIDSDFSNGVVNGIFTKKISTAGGGNNPVADSPLLDIKIDPNGTSIPSNRLLNITYGTNLTPTHSFGETTSTLNSDVNIIGDLTVNGIISGSWYNVAVSSTSSITWNPSTQGKRLSVTFSAVSNLTVTFDPAYIPAIGDELEIRIIYSTQAGGSYVSINIPNNRDLTFTYNNTPTTIINLNGNSDSWRIKNAPEYCPSQKTLRALQTISESFHILNVGTTYSIDTTRRTRVSYSSMITDLRGVTASGINAPTSTMIIGLHGYGGNVITTQGSRIYVKEMYKPGILGNNDSSLVLRHAFYMNGPGNSNLYFMGDSPGALPSTNIIAEGFGVADLVGPFAYKYHTCPPYTSPGGQYIVAALCTTDTSTTSTVVYSDDYGVTWTTASAVSRVDKIMVHHSGGTPYIYAATATDIIRCQVGQTSWTIVYNLPSNPYVSKCTTLTSTPWGIIAGKLGFAYSPDGSFGSWVNLSGNEVNCVSTSEYVIGQDFVQNNFVCRKGPRYRHIDNIGYQGLLASPLHKNTLDPYFGSYTKLEPQSNILNLIEPDYVQADTYESRTMYVKHRYINLNF